MPPVQQKVDAREIELFLDNLSTQSWLKGSRENWTSYVYHFTDVRNAVEILKSGKLLCRAELDRRKAMVVDNASRIVIANTASHVHDYVRLYFRPQTPTQYRNEGIRPKAQQSLESHCPIPIFFLFDAKEILTRSDSSFSDGNLAAGASLHNTADALANFNFRDIYHIGSIPEYAKKNIIYHRNAEVVVHNELDLSSLKFIFCRSRAEKDTFLHLLPTEKFKEWQRKVLVDSKSQFYHRKWSFVESVEMTTERVTFTFSPDTLTPGTFQARLIFTDQGTSKQYSYEQNKFMANGKTVAVVPEGVKRYEVKLWLDEDLAFADAFYNEDLPF
jgi:hypothetical protein